MSQENQQNQDNSKVQKQYDGVIAKLTSVLSGSKLEIPSKIGNDQAAKLAEELFKEETEQNYKNFKEELKTLIKTHVQFKKEVTQKENELKQLEINKQKEFIKKANEVFNKIENINVLHSDYTKSLGEAAMEIADLNNEENIE